MNHTDTGSDTSTRDYIPTVPPLKPPPATTTTHLCGEEKDGHVVVDVIDMNGDGGGRGEGRVPLVPSHDREEMNINLFSVHLHVGFHL